MRATRVALVLSLLLAASAAALLSVVPAGAAVHTLKLGAGYAAASNASASSARAFTGSGSWYELYPSAKTEFYVDAATQLGGVFTVDQVASVTYHTVNGATNPSGADFFSVLYTQPFVGGDASWYGRRLTSEPYLSNGYVPPAAWVWNTWATAPGANQLTFFDSNHCGNQGFYGAPTLADVQAGPITWATWPGNPTAGSAEATPFDYGAQPVKFVSFQTGSGWSAFEGYLDAITIALTTGETYVLDLEPATDPLYVDAAWTGAPAATEVAPGRWIGWNAFAKVQDAVTAAVPGGTIHVAAGTYTEQVVINGKNVSILGAGRASTTIESPASLATSFSSGGPNNFPVVLAQNAANVVIRDLTVDGAGRGNANYRFQGVAYWNAGGQLLDCDVEHVEDTPFSGAQHGVAVYVNSNTAGPYAFEMGGCNLTDFQKNGTVFAGPGLTLNVHDCTVAGKGPSLVTAQNGIQAGGIPSASISNTVVSGCYWTGATWSASGMLLYQIPSLAVSGGSVQGSQSSIYTYDCSGTITGCDVQTPSGGGIGAWGIGAYNFNTSIAAKAGGRTMPHPQPFDVELGGGTPKQSTSFTMTVTGGCITGPGVAGTTGVDVWSDGGAMTANVTGAEISGWDDGIVTAGTGTVTTNASGNAITANLTAGYDGAAGLTHNATNNWWGNAGGPGAGGANPVVGAVAYTPWLVSGADLTPGCGFTPPPTTIAPGAPVTCITPANPCVAIPVTITRSGSDPMRAFSVDVTLSPNLAVCGASFTGGTYLLGLPNFAWYANGPNTWTVDGASLGLPCGATAPTGLLFTLYVSSTSPSGTGTVTLSNPQLRDCGNVPLAAVAGGAATITIDNTSPAAVTALAAAQVTTGNDANGTTKIQLTFTAPGDAAAVKVYRAPFGQYPEYDDAGGAAPAAPGAYPPAAPWTLTAVTATGQADEPATRDWWYYVAYAQDACGNWSAASNVTGGTLNYHLGDVSDGMVAGQGDNLVAMGDISMLGFHYGITLAPFDTWNFLDVGPTTNNYVNGRPLTDSKVNFEDLMMFALNYGQVSLPSGPQRRVEGDANTLAVRAPSAVTAGSTFDVALVIHGVGDLQGLSARLAWDAAVAAPVSVRAGELLAAANGVAYAPEPGGVDAAVLGTGATIGGDGVLATVTFRANAAGDPRVKLAGVEGRDGANRPLALGAVSAPTPVTTQLAAAQPNPFRGTTTIAWSLARPGVAELAVYSVDGRLVRTLASGAHEAGSYRVHWNGADDQGRALRAGVYFVRMRTAEGVQRRSVVLVP